MPFGRNRHLFCGMESNMAADALRFLGAVADPASLLGILVLASTAAALTTRHRLMLILQGAAAAIVVFLGILPGATWLASPLETRFGANPPLPGQIDGILTIGGTERVDQSEAWGEPILSDPTPIAAFLALGRQYPDAKMVFAGGGVSHSAARLTEAAVIRNFLAELGFDGDRVVYEDRSRNTWENAVFAHELVKPAPGERWILVAEPIALPRAVGAFRRAGWQVIPFPAGHLTDGDRNAAPSLHLRSGLDLASIAVHEWGGLIAYRMLGYTQELFPR